MSVGADHPGHGQPQCAESAQHVVDRILITVLPARHDENRNLDVSVMVADARVAPIPISGLVAAPLIEPETHAFDPVAPHAFPTITDDDGIGWGRQPAEHAGSPTDVVHHHRPAHVVDVVVVPVIGAAVDDDGLQRGRAVPPSRHHQRVDGTPRFTHHPDVAIADREGGDLLDHLDAVGKLLVGVFVGQRSLGVPTALKIDPEGQVVVVGEPGIHFAVGVHRSVAAAVRVQFDDRRAPDFISHGVRVVPVMAGQHDGALARDFHGESDVLGERHHIKWHRQVLNIPSPDGLFRRGRGFRRPQAASERSGDRGPDANLEDRAAAPIIHVAPSLERKGPEPQANTGLVG